jgi:group I intron endonuclease
VLLYTLTNTVNGKMYIGKTCHATPYRRWKRHQSSARAGSRLPIHCALTKYGPEQFIVAVLSVHQTPEELSTAEVNAIHDYHTQCPNGYNVSIGGDGGSGPCTEATKEKLRILRKGIKLPEEWCRHIGDSHRGKKREPWPEERKAKLSLIMTGRRHAPCSQELREKLSALHLGKKRGPMSQEHKLKISLALKGRTLPPCSAEHRRRISEAKKGKPSWNSPLKVQ